MSITTTTASPGDEIRRSFASENERIERNAEITALPDGMDLESFKDLAAAESLVAHRQAAQEAVNALPAQVENNAEQLDRIAFGNGALAGDVSERATAAAEKVNATRDAEVLASMFKSARQTEDSVMQRAIGRRACELAKAHSELTGSPGPYEGLVELYSAARKSQKVDQAIAALYLGEPVDGLSANIQFAIPAPKRLQRFNSQQVAQMAQRAREAGIGPWRG